MYQSAIRLSLSLLIISMLPLSLFGQAKTDYRLVYEPSLEILKEHLSLGNFDTLVKRLEELTPIDTLFEGEYFEEVEEPSTYAIIGYNTYTLEVELYSPMSLTVDLLESKRHLYLRIYDLQKQQLDTSVKVFHEEYGEIPFDAEVGAYKFRNKKEFDLFDILIVKNGKGVFYSGESEAFYRLSFAERAEDWFDKLFFPNDYTYRYRLSSTPLNYIALNKPKFRVGDSLKIKSFLVKKNGRPYKESVGLYLTYLDQERQYKKYLIDTLNPFRPGAFYTTFEIADSLLGKSITLEIRSLSSRRQPKGKELNSVYFSVEDYTLNRVGFEMEVLREKEIPIFNPSEKIQLKYSAKDDNGNAAMDGRIVLRAFVEEPKSKLHSLYRYPSFVLDTILAINPTGSGLFMVPHERMPEISGILVIEAEYIGSSGENHRRVKRIKWQCDEPSLKLIYKSGMWQIVKSSHSSLPNNSEVELIKRPRYGFQENIDNTLSRQKIEIPYSFNNGLPSSEYTYEITVDRIVQENIAFEDQSWKMLFHNFEDGKLKIWNGLDDSCLYFFEVRKGDEVLIRNTTHSSDTLTYNIKHEEVMLSYWNSCTQKGNCYEITDKSKFLREFEKKPNLTLSGPTRIFPGDSAKWEIELHKKDKALEDVDFLFMSYKGKQFNEIPIAYEFPTKRARRRYPTNYNRHRSSDLYNSIFELEEPSKRQINRLDPQWKKRLALDSVGLFQYMFLEDAQSVFYRPLPSNQMTKSQLAVFLFDGSKIISVQYFSVDNKIKYFKNFSDGNYSAPVSPGFHSLNIRSLDHLFQVSAIEARAGYKTELVIDISRLPSSIIQIPMPSKLDENELRLLLSSYTRIKANRDFRVQQDLMYYDLKAYTDYVVGPLEQDAMQIKWDEGSLSLVYQPYSRYLLELDQRMIEKTHLNEADFSLTALNRQYKNQYPGSILNYPSEEKSEIPTPFFSTWSRILSPDSRAKANLNILIQNQSISTFIYHIEDSALYLTHSNPSQYYPSSSYNSFFLPLGNYLLISTDVLQQRSSIDSLKIEDGYKYLYQPSVDQLKEVSAITVLTPLAQRMSYKKMRSFKKDTALAKGTLKGRVIDSKTDEGIPFATVILKLKKDPNILFSATSDMDGHFLLNDIPSELYTLFCSFIGYEDFILKDFNINNLKTITIDLQQGNLILEEIEVAWSAPLIDGTKSARSANEMEVMNMAVRDVGGLPSQFGDMTSGVFQFDAGEESFIRGSRDQTTVYFIDGVKVRGSVNLPHSTSITNEILHKKEPEDGIENNWKTRQGSIRNHFQDYAFFIPDVRTDEEGKASIRVKYPDDIAYWENILIGIDPKEGLLRKQLGTQSFSILSCELAIPRYLVRGDSCLAIGKTTNYSNTELQVEHEFKVNDVLIQQQKRSLENMFLDALPLLANDSLNISYSVALESGYKDGENRTLTILEKGSSISLGAFYVLKGDTSIQFNLDSTQDIRLHTMFAFSDLILEEVTEQIQYVHNCNEQMASKLKALLAMESVSEGETKEKEIQKLILALMNNVNNAYSWSWWGKSNNSHAWMTHYILEALVRAYKRGYSVPDLQKMVQYHWQNLPYTPEIQRNNMLYTLSNFNSNYSLNPHLESIAFDSLDVEGKLKYAILAETANLSYPEQSIQKLIKKDIFGNIYVGQSESYKLASSLHLSALFGEWLKARNDSLSLDLLCNYVLLNKQQFSWNTIERAAAIDIFELKKRGYSSTENEFKIRWDSEPEQILSLSKNTQNRAAKSLGITKSGQATAFVSISTKVFDPNPEVDSENFALSYSFMKDGQKSIELEVGKVTNMQVNILAKHKAEYVMLEIPIPAGCALDDHPIYIQNGHSELKGDKLYVYYNSLPEGNTQLEISLLAHYAGRYTLNPLRAELMYFPELNGNSKITKVDVNEQAEF